MSEPGFVVGGRYANAAGDYDVLAIEDGKVRIRYARGLELTLPAGGLWSQWEQLVAERTGRPLTPAKAATAPRPATSRPSAPRSTGTARTAAPRLPKKAPSGEAGFFFAAGYLAAGCDLTASVAGRDYLAFAQRYQILTGRGLSTPHAGLDVHERPTHKSGADLAVTFPATEGIRPLLILGKDTPLQPAPQPGFYAVNKTEAVERLLKLGFDLGRNDNPATVRSHIPAGHHDDFDRGVALRNQLRR